MIVASCTVFLIVFHLFSCSPTVIHSHAAAVCGGQGGGKHSAQLLCPGKPKTNDQLAAGGGGARDQRKVLGRQQQPIMGINLICDVCKYRSGGLSADGPSAPRVCAPNGVSPKTNRTFPEGTFARGLKTWFKMCGGFSRGFFFELLK